MRSVRISTDCDRCLDDTSGDVHIDADFTLLYQVSEDENSQRYRLDLCANHAGQLTIMEAIRLGTAFVPDEVLQNTPPLTMRGRAQVACTICGKPYSVGSGMSLHMKSKHPEAWEPGPASNVVRNAKHKKGKGSHGQ